MEQHPIPQNVSSYQFKLVGDMTLKQFFQVAGGLLVALIFYSSPLLGIIKWPFAILSALLGAGLAFLPLEERPLERWIFAFFKAVYSPTVFIWQRTKTPPKYFQDEAPVDATPQDPALKNYLATANQTTGASGNLEKAESGFLSKIAALFTINPTPATNTVPVVAAPAAPTDTAQVVQIPENTLVKMRSNIGHIVVEEKPVVSVVQNQVTANQVAPVVAGNEMVSTKQAIFSIDAAPPNPPTQTNVVVGQVVDQNRKIIEGAIIEIRDSMGRPIRALRSNRAGHFITVTQLDNGHYEIITEKDDYSFSAVSFDATGSIIPPILVQGKNLGSANQNV